MKTIYQIILALTVAALLTACVPQRKYQDLQSAQNELNRKYETTKANLTNLEEAVKEQEAQLRDYEKRVGELRRDTTLKGERYRSISALNRELERLYKEIQAQNEALVAKASSDKVEMTETLSMTQAQLKEKEQELARKESELLLLKNNLSIQEQNIQRLQADLQAREKRMNELQADLQAREASVAQLTSDLQSREVRVNELEAAISRQEEQVLALKEKLNQALRGFSASELTVEERDGKIYVSLSQELLFASGSKTIDPKGKQAIRTLAEVLTKNPDIDIMIEGHTDDVGEASGNWDLSVLRATSVVKELTKNNVDPARIIASGRGEHIPVATNSTSDGKAQNRRTEIILSPKLDELYQIIGQ